VSSSPPLFHNATACFDRCTAGGRQLTISGQVTHSAIQIACASASGLKTGFAANRGQARFRETNLMQSLGACNGGGGGGGGGKTDPGTAAGTYMFTVTATTGTGVSLVTSTAQVTVTVQKCQTAPRTRTGHPNNKRFNVAAARAPCRPSGLGS
jgi:hypothetical protein